MQNCQLKPLKPCEAESLKHVLNYGSHYIKRHCGTCPIDFPLFSIVPGPNFFRHLWNFNQFVKNSKIQPEQCIFTLTYKKQHCILITWAFNRIQLFYTSHTSSGVCTMWQFLLVVSQECFSLFEAFAWRVNR